MKKKINLLRFILYRELGLVNNNLLRNFYVVLPRNYDDHKFYFDQL